VVPRIKGVEEIGVDLTMFDGYAEHFVSLLVPACDA
jgi:hypothetical protein